MAAFDDNFELMPATAPPNNPPSGYTLEVSPPQSYLDGTGWVVEHGAFTARRASKDTFAVASTGWIEVEMGFSAVSAFYFGFYNNDFADGTAMAFSMQTYNGGAATYNNNVVVNSFTVAVSVRYKFRLDRAGSVFRFRAWANGTAMFDQSATATGANDGLLVFKQAENPIKILRIAANDGDLPLPNPLTLVEKTSTSVTLECPVMPNAVNYFWYRLVSSAWFLEATTNNNSVTISDLPSGSSQQFKVQYGVLP